MAEFFYEALDRNGQSVRGFLEAGGEDVVVERLRRIGYAALSVERRGRPLWRRDMLAALPLRRNRVKTRHLATFTRQLATLLSAGLPLRRALGVTARQTESAGLRRCLAQIIRDIDKGVTLAEGLGRHPRIFDDAYVNMVRAGEVGGMMEFALGKLAAYEEQRAKWRSRIRSALMYPAMVFVVSGLVVAFLLYKVVPKFAEIFEQLGAELPGLTSALVRASELVRSPDGLWLLAGAGVVWWLAGKLYATDSGRLLTHRVWLKVPVFGDLYRKMTIARFAGTFAALLRAGVPIRQALPIVQSVCANEVVARAIARVHENVMDGEPMHEPIAQCPVFPPIVARMVAVGEETGEVDRLLEKIEEAYEREVDDMVAGFASIMEPLMIVFLGVIIGTIVVALYGSVNIFPCGCRMVK
ncbi:MAG: type II secretion system F family protein [Sumerlaeia bacterium]